MTSFPCLSSLHEVAADCYILHRTASIFVGLGSIDLYIPRSLYSETDVTIGVSNPRLYLSGKPGIFPIKRGAGKPGSEPSTTPALLLQSL